MKKAPDIILYKKGVYAADSTRRRNYIHRRRRIMKERQELTAGRIKRRKEGRELSIREAGKVT